MPSAEAILFALAFDDQGRVLVTESAGSPSSYTAAADSGLTAISATLPDSDQQVASRPVTVGDHVYAANASSSAYGQVICSQCVPAAAASSFRSQVRASGTEPRQTAMWLTCRGS
jgi:hypothetical protein